ncbi:hypothetical protein F4802DRAFT_70047 [Xylaria palmicola]|nr:hypothetical protein F4802DRAFT_70047 [Xylaria palmicola]
MAREFTISLDNTNLAEARLRLDNEYDENGNPIAHRDWVTGIDRQGKAAEMAVKGRMPTVVHGFEQPGSKVPYTLLIFEWSTERLRLDKRFREMTIEVSFTVHGSRRDAEPEAQRLHGRGIGRVHWDPEVCAIAPDRTDWYHRTSHPVADRVGADFVLQANVGGFFTAGPRVHWERSDSANRTDAIQLTGNRVTVGPGHSRPNAVRWVMLENASQKSGVPAFLRTAVLLKRRPKDNGQFLGTVKVTYRVSKLHDFKETLLSTMGKLPVDQPIIFDPRVSTSYSGFDPSKLAEAGANLAKEFELASLEPLPAQAAPATEEGIEAGAELDDFEVDDT